MYVVCAVTCVYINSATCMAVNESFVCPGIKDWNIYSDNAVSGAP